MGWFNEVGKSLGIVQHRETKRWFEYRRCTHEWGLQHGFRHEIAVNDLGYGFRFANVLKTVASVCVDESDEGLPVIERWPIRHSA